jgi:hypothetical protein
MLEVGQSTKEGQVCVREADGSNERKPADQRVRQQGRFYQRRFACDMVLVFMHTHKIGSEVGVIADVYRQP